MRPLDPRLLRYARSTRGFLLLSVAIGVLVTIAIIIQAKLLSSVIVNVTSEGWDWSAASESVFLLAGIFLTRALLSWGVEVAAVRSSARAKQQLREASIEHILALGPNIDNRGEISALVTRGVDALDSYYARYLPQLILAVIVPIAVLVTILTQDILSAIIIAVCIPIIPIFMILIGLYTKSQVDKQWRTLAVLSGHFLDLVSGLPTLKVFGRAHAQVAAIRSIGDRYRSTTMGVLRVSFLSSLALELLATLSVALVAVSVGLRLAEGQIAYSVALFVLVLAPEAFLPLRLVGQHFHAAAEGLGAADRLFTLLETPVPNSQGTLTPCASPTIVINDLSVTYPERDRPALLPVTFTARPGSITALIGNSGGGKSTVLSALLGFLEPSSGSVQVCDHELDALSIAEWRATIGWLPQHPSLISANLEGTLTVADAVAAGRDVSTEQVREALASVGVLEELAQGERTPLHADGSGVSAGQRQRIALARAIVTHPSVLLLDEPTAALDGESEEAVVEVIREAAVRGATVIVVAHRPSLVACADQVVRVHPDLAPEVSELSASSSPITMPRGW